MADKNATLVWNEEKQINEFVYTDVTPEEAAEAKRQRDEREAEIAVEVAAKAELEDLTVKARKDIDSIASLLAEVKDPSVQKLLEIVFARLDLTEKSSRIDYSAAAEVAQDKRKQ